MAKRKTRDFSEVIREQAKTNPVAARAARMADSQAAKRKSLGQICFDGFVSGGNTVNKRWSESLSHNDWERAAAAVEREVLRRWGMLEADPPKKPKAKKGKS